MEYSIIIEKDEKTGFFSGQCVQLPEAISQGETVDELLDNIKEAISLTLESSKSDVNNRFKGRKIFRRRVSVL